MENGGILDVFLKVEQTVPTEEWNKNEREKEKSGTLPTFSVRTSTTAFPLQVRKENFTCI